MKIIDIQKPQEWESVELFPLSDLHIGDPKTDIKMFREFVKYIKEQENRLLIYNGDNANNAIKSSVSNIYTETMSPREQKQFLKEELAEISDRFIAWIPGNHENRTSKECDSHMVEDLAEYFGQKEIYRPDEAAIKLSFGRTKNPKKKQVYSIYCTHGSGGGKRPGSAINNLELLGLSIDADIYIVGHTHKKLAYKNGFRRLDLRNNKVVQTERLFVISSSWSDFGGYAARLMLTPSAKGATPIYIDGRKKYFWARV